MGLGYDIPKDAAINVAGRGVAEEGSRALSRDRANYEKHSQDAAGKLPRSESALNARSVNGIIQS